MNEDRIEYAKPTIEDREHVVASLGDPVDGGSPVPDSIGF